VFGPFHSADFGPFSPALNGPFRPAPTLRAFHIVSVPFEGQMLDWLKVKDKVSVLCQLSVQEGIEYGSKLNFIPYDIAVIEE